MKMSDKERQMMVNLYDSPTWGVWKKHFLVNRQLELAQASPFHQEMNQVIEGRGRIMELNYQEREMAALKKKQEAKERTNG